MLWTKNLATVIELCSKQPFLTLNSPTKRYGATGQMMEELVVYHCLKTMKEYHSIIGEQPIHENKSNNKDPVLHITNSNV
jgi:hypothetical protein